MSTTTQFPDSYYPIPPMNITPCAPTPNHTLYLTNIDDQMYTRAPANYVYLFKKSPGMDTLKSSLSRVLVDYYPFTGRFRTSSEDENKLVLDCNGEGVVFAEASMNITVEELLKTSMLPNKSWKNISCKVESKKGTHLPLAIQVTSLHCGGIILCASISHVMCDGTGASQFLNAWAELTRNPNSDLTITPSHDRQILKNREPPQVNSSHPIYTEEPTNPNSEQHIFMWFLTQSLVTVSITFSANEILCLKKQCTTSSLKDITSFEALTAHTWRSFVKAGHWPLSRSMKLCFTFNFRKKMKLPEGYYGNGFVLASAESTMKDLVVANNLDHCVKLVQQAKAGVNEEYVKSTIDVLKDKTLVPDGSLSLLVTQWTRLGLEDVDFGEGKPLYTSPTATQFYCLFLPVIGDPKAIRVLFSVPKQMVEKFQHNMTEIDNWDKYEYKLP